MKLDDDFAQLLIRAAACYDRLTPKQKVEHDWNQRISFALGNLRLMYERGRFTREMVEDEAIKTADRDCFGTVPGTVVACGEDFGSEPQYCSPACWGAALAKIERAAAKRGYLK